MPAHSSFALALGLLLGWSTAQAAPTDEDASHHHNKKTRRPVEPAPVKDAGDAIDGDNARTVALDASDDELDAADDKDAHKDAARLAKDAPAPRSHGWQLQIGPYLWASAVQARVGFGPLTTGIEIGFLDLVSHTRYGGEAAAELRHGRFAVSADVMYGAEAFTAGTTIASVMTTVTGNASSLMFDAAAGYQVLGDDDSAVSLEARSGIRYQRTTVSGELGVAGITVQTPELVDGGSDLVVGARAVVRPGHSIRLSGMFDVGVAGSSDSTWSAAVDAGLLVSSRVLVTAGWRTLSTERSRVNVQMSGPRVAAQLVF
jgi:hypothetical protein